MKTQYYILRLLLSCFVGLGVALATPLPSSDHMLQGDPTVRIRVVNSVTGRSVDGALMELREEVGNGLGLSRRITSGERLDVATGVYDMRLQADGFLSVATRVTAGPGVRNIEINIDPLEVPRQLNPEYVRSLHRRDATVVVGCVVDEESRLPIAGVRVLSVRDGRRVTTDREGFFAIHVDIAGNASMREQPAAILFERDGFQGQLHNYLEVWSNGDQIYKIRLNAGSGLEVIDERSNRRGGELEKVSSDTCTSCVASGSESMSSAFPHNISNPSSASGTSAVTSVIPSMIRVGRTCTGSSCTTVEYYTFETYCKHVVSAEVYDCWGNLPGGMSSLRAFSVPVRSFGLWYVYHPISTTYDICSTTSCQAFDDNISTNSNTAVNETAGMILVDGNGAVQRTEYSAENNDAGCGDGYAGNGTSSPCISDPVCFGKSKYGHGRGFCQWGSVRWATGTVVDKVDSGGNGACALGPAHAYGTKDWLQIVSHYYPNYQLGQAISVSIYHARFSPTTPADPGTKIYVVDSVQSSGTTNLLLGAAIAPTGTTNWAWDDSNDVSVDLQSGKQIMVRQYKVPASSGGGSYDLQVALWFDDNNNYQIDPQGPTGDVLIGTYFVAHALTVTGPVSVESSDPALPQVPYLAQNFPNPFNPSTTIEYQVATSGLVKLTVHSVLGEIATVLVNEERSPGTYNVDWNAADLPSGVYFVRMQAVAGDRLPFSATRKIVLLK